jgi:cysteinyl-tRNA synthetase
MGRDILRWGLVLCAAVALGAAGCGDDGDDEEAPRTLTVANDYTYWLQDIDLNALGASAFDAAIIDYSSDGGDEGRWSAAALDALQHSAGGDKVALAYVSIGEAEDYRFYWRSGWSPGNPSWLGPENEEWPGNYEVRFWQAGWQTLVYQYLDRVLAQGFDGVYLDKVDAYEYWEGGRPSARADMAAFVGEIASYCRGRKAGFLIVPQNGHELIDEAGYAGRIDALGSEDNWFDGDDALSAEERQYREEYLDKYRAAGKPVFAVDYCRGAANIDYVYNRARAKGYVPYCTVRDLDRLIVNPGHAPD